MSRPAHTGHTTARRLQDAVDALEQLHREFERLETERAQCGVERDRYRDALKAIGYENSGHWGTIARAALRPKPTEDD